MYIKFSIFKFPIPKFQFSTFNIGFQAFKWIIQYLINNFNWINTVKPFAAILTSGYLFKLQSIVINVYKIQVRREENQS